ncbi:MAG TPA: hypothetical protein VK364_13710, partial [Hymenobacter sp.]|nr:hypothetical protein [Hymenobacter sp.]
MIFTPSPMLLKLLYTRGSLHNTPNGVAFSIKNRLDTVYFTRLDYVQIGQHRVTPDHIALDLGDGDIRPVPDALSRTPNGLEFAVGHSITFNLTMPPLPEGIHAVQVKFAADPFGDLHVEVEDAIVNLPDNRTRIPRNEQDDYSEAAIQARQRFAEEFSGQPLKHLK